MNGLKFTALRPQGIAVAAGAVGTPGEEALKKSAQNLLAHIPGEASGFYLMAVGALTRPTPGNLWFLFALAFIILVVVRWAAKASTAIMATSIIAFVLWMFVLDNGVFHALFPNLLPGALGLIVAVFYSTIVTVLANYNKLS